MSIGTALFRFHRAVIAPERGGAALALARAALLAPAAAYGLGVRARNGLYRRGWAKSYRAGPAVISVGNITAGGTGKTPLVAWLARLLVIRKMQPAILSRGYGRDARLGVDDENLMLSSLAQDIPVVVDSDRIRGADRAVREHGANVLILDDGFQHRRIARDLDIVLIDAVWPFGAGHLLPRGLLREPLGELSRADFLLLTRTNLVTPDAVGEITARLAKLAPRVPTACCAVVVRRLKALGRGDAERLPADALKRGRWAAFCGIGNPEGFRLTLRKAGCEPAFMSVFSDHERYCRRQVELVLGRAVEAGCDAVVTTEKDAVKVEQLLRGTAVPAVYALQTDLDFAKGSDALTAAILRAVERAG